MRSALSTSTVSFVAEIDSAVYESTQQSVRQFLAKGRTDYVDLVIEIAQVVGIQLPTTLSSPFEYTKALALLNPGVSHDGAQWAWTPPSIKLKPLAGDDKSAERIRIGLARQ